MIFFAFFLISCADDTQPNIKELVLQDIKENGFVLDAAFDRVYEATLDQGDLQTLASTLNTQDAFITHMNNVVDHVVLDVIESHTEWNDKPELWDVVANKNTWGQAAIQNNLKQIALENITTADPISAALDLYSKQIDDELDLLEGELVLIENYEFENGGVRPIDQLTLNFGRVNSGTFGRGQFGLRYDQISTLKEAIGVLILNGANTNLDEAVNDFVAENPDTEILAAILVPAIQKIRVPSGATNSYKRFTDLIFGTRITPDRDAFDRQARYAAFLSALDFILSDDYNNHDQDFASVPVQAAMEHGVTVLAWARVSN